MECDGIESHIYMNWSHLLLFYWCCCWSSVPLCLVLQEMLLFFILCMSFGHYLCVRVPRRETETERLLEFIAVLPIMATCWVALYSVSVNGHFEFSQSFKSFLHLKGRTKDFTNQKVGKRIHNATVDNKSFH